MTRVTIERGAASTWPEQIEEDRNDSDNRSGGDSVAAGVVRYRAPHGAVDTDVPQPIRGGVSGAALVLVLGIIVWIFCLVDYRALVESETDYIGAEERYHQSLGHGMAREGGQ